MPRQGGLPAEAQELPPELYNLLASGELNPEAIRLIQAMARNPQLFRQGPNFKQLLFERAMGAPSEEEMIDGGYEQ